MIDKPAQCCVLTTSKSKTETMDMEKNAQIIIKLYLDWLNNFITVEAFAAHYGLSVAEAARLIEVGRYIRSFDASPLGEMH